MEKPGRCVYKQDDGSWINKTWDQDRSSTTHDTLLMAMDEARRMLRNEGGGQLTIKGEDGSIKDVSIILPRDDRHSPRGK